MTCEIEASPIYTIPWPILLEIEQMMCEYCVLLLNSRLCEIWLAFKWGHNNFHKTSNNRPHRTMRCQVVLGWVAGISSILIEYAQFPRKSVNLMCLNREHTLEQNQTSHAHLPANSLNSNQYSHLGCSNN